MEALGSLNPLETAEGMIQEKVAHFLAAKASLNRLRNHPSVQIRAEAEALYAMQKKLEGDLQTTLAKIETLKKNPWSFGEIIDVSSFAVKMSTHINKVTKLQERGATGPGAAAFQAQTFPGFGLDMIPTSVMYGGLALGGVLLLKMMKVF